MEEKEKNIITINGTDYKLKGGLKAMIAFEEITDKAFAITTTKDMLAYIYAAIVAGNPEGIRVDGDVDGRLSFEDLIDAFDADPKLLTKATEIVLQRKASEHIVELLNEGGPEPKKE